MLLDSQYSQNLKSRLSFEKSNMMVSNNSFFKRYVKIGH